MGIRPLARANSQEIATVLTLQIRAYQEEARLLNFPALPPLQETTEDLSNKKILTFIWEEINSIKGAVMLERHDDHMQITKLFVDPHSFRRGIGRQLVQHCLAEYTKADFFVQTAKKNYPAISLYEDLGFKFVREWLAEEKIPLVELAFISAKSRHI